MKSWITRLTVMGAALQAVAAEMPRTVVIFIDTSGSIQTEQFKDMKNQVRTLVKTLDSRTEVEIYPLDASANAPAARLQTRGLAYDASAREISDLDEFLKKLDTSRTPASSKERQSCILNSLYHARNRVSELRKAGRSVDLLYVSDMLEDCSSNDTKKPINFTANVSEAEVQQALANLRKLPQRSGWLKGARATVLVPPRIAPGTEVPLTLFWREVMAMHGAEVPAPDDPLLLTSIPFHLQPSRGRSR